MFGVECCLHWCLVSCFPGILYCWHGNDIAPLTSASLSTDKSLLLFSYTSMEIDRDRGPWLRVKCYPSYNYNTQRNLILTG